MDYKEKFISLINDKTLPIEQRKKLKEIYNSSVESEDMKMAQTKNGTAIKVTELMVKDWVYSFNHEKCKVCQINVIGIPTVELDSYDNDDGCFILDCEPVGIPITKEILEKNGFEGIPYAFLKLDGNSWLEYYYHEHRLRKYWQGIDEWNNHAEVKELTFQCECYYIHELQHAFHLMKITKEIEL